MANKKSFWYRLGKAWSKRDEVWAEVFEDPSLIGMTPEAQLGLLLGEKFNDVVQWIADNWSAEEINEFFGDVPMGQTPESWIGIKMGEGLAGATENWSAGVEEGEYENLSPDEKDALREEKAKFTESKGIDTKTEGPSALEIQSQMGKAFDEDETIQDVVGAPEVTNQDILKRTPIGGLSGQQLEMYLNAVADGGLTPEEAYRNVTQSNLTAFVTDDDGKIQFEEVTKEDGTKVFIPLPVQVQPESLFMNGFINHIRRQNPAAINELKQFLVLSGIAEEDDFDDTGEMDPRLENLIETLMANANYKYSHVTYGSHEWNELVDSVPRNFGWVLESDMDREKASWALLGRAIVDYKDDMAFIEKADLKAKEKEYEASMDIPGVGEMSLRIDAFFNDALGRPPTPEERNRFLNEWNTGYDTYVQKNIAAYKAATYGADMERYLIENGESITAEEEKALMDDIQAGGDVLTGIVGEREVEADFITDEDIYYNTVWNMTQYTDKVKAGKDKREHQANLMKLITGKI